MNIIEILGERITTDSADSYLSNLRLRKIGKFLYFI